MSSQAPQSIPKGEPASSRGGAPDLQASGSVNPDGASGSCLHAMAINPKLPVFLGSKSPS